MWQLAKNPEVRESGVRIFSIIGSKLTWIKIECVRWEHHVLATQTMHFNFPGIR